MTATQTETLRAAAYRALKASPRWAAVTKDLPPRSLERIGPVDIEACTPDELDDIAVWAIGRDVPMPAHLAAYLGAAKEASPVLRLPRGSVFHIDGSRHIASPECEGCSRGTEPHECGGNIHEESVYGPSIIKTCDGCEYTH